MQVNIMSNITKESTIYIGIDVHKKTLYCTFIDGEVLHRKSFPNSEALLKYITKRYLGRHIKACYEAGYFGYSLKMELEEHGVETLVVNPADIPTTDKDRKSKTDKRDSRKLAESLKSGVLRSIYVPNSEELGARSKVRLRMSLARMRAKIKTKIKSDLTFMGIKYPEEFADNERHWTKRFINWLSDLDLPTEHHKYTMSKWLEQLEYYKVQIKEVEKELEELMHQDKYRKWYKILRSVPGIGKITAITILLEIPNIGRFKKKDQFISYIGLVPTEKSSGEKQRMGRMTNRCNKYLRSLFVESAWVAIRQDQELTSYYNNACKRMLKTQAIILVAKKLAFRVRYLLLNEDLYRSQGINTGKLKLVKS